MQLLAGSVVPPASARVGIALLFSEGKIRPDAARAVFQLAWSKSREGPSVPGLGRGLVWA